MVIKLHINPSPQDRKCECCKKHMNDIKPFGKEGDPLVGNFEGVKLLKNFRVMLPRSMVKYDIDKYMNNDVFDEEKFIKENGKEELERFWMAEQLSSTIEASWECRDCFILNENDYYKKRYR